MAELDRDSFYFFMDSPAQRRIASHCSELNYELSAEASYRLIADKLDEYKSKIEALENFNIFSMFFLRKFKTKI